MAVSQEMPREVVVAFGRAGRAWMATCAAGSVADALDVGASHTDVVQGLRPEERDR